MATRELSLLCACQGEDDGLISISFHYGLEGMGKETPYKLAIPQCGTIQDAFEDIKEKLSKIVKKVEKRQRKKNQKNSDKESDSQSSSGKTGSSDEEDDSKASSADQSTPPRQLCDVSIDFENETTGEIHKEEEEEETTKTRPEFENPPKKNDSNEKSNSHLIDMKLRSGHEILDGMTDNLTAWQTGNCLIVTICGLTVKYTIYYNPPQIEHLQIPNTIMVNYMLYPRADFVRCNIDTCDIEWYKCERKPRVKINFAYKKLFFDNSSNCSESNQNSSEVTELQPIKTEIIEKFESSREWESIGTGFVYMPQESDVGYYIKVVCRPQSGKYSVEFTVESQQRVRGDPGPCPFERRHLETKYPTGEGSFRVMCYNILADKYANTKTAMDLYYPYCPPYALGLDYRKQLFMKEIMGYKADIICLQEVDQKVYSDDLMPILGMHGYNGYLKTKARTVSAGVSIFYNKQKFKLVGRYDREVSKSLEEEELYRDLLSKISESERLRERAIQTKAMLMVQVLESVERPGRLLLVANTHLTCGQRIPHIRAIQVTVMLKYIEVVIEKHYKDCDLSVVLCGDLNALPESAVVKLLSDGKVDNKHADWFAGGRPEYVSNLSVETTLTLQPAYREPRYTNYVSCFYGTIDYIFHDRQKLETVKTVAFPPHSDVLENTACPSVKFPSDHMALVCELKWKDV